MSSQESGPKTNIYDPINEKYQVFSDGTSEKQKALGEAAAGYGLILDSDVSDLTQTSENGLPPSSLELVLDNELDLITFRDAMSGFELTTTAEFYDQIRQIYGSASNLRQSFMDLRQSVLADPHGENNIDEFSHTDSGKYARIVQKLPKDSPLAQLVPGKPLAIKTSGIDMTYTRNVLESGEVIRSKLPEQFRNTKRFIKYMQMKHPRGFLDGTIDVADVYAVMREPSQEGEAEPREWMLMEYVSSARSLTSKWKGVRLSFSAKDEPQLTTAFLQDRDSGFQDQYHCFDDLAGEMLKSYYNQVDLPIFNFMQDCLIDMSGSNILFRKNPNKDEAPYALIDVHSISTDFLNSY